jgi:hypothetical protein
MRGTLHAIAAEDLAWLVPLVVRPGIANAHRRLREEGVPEDQPERAIELIARALERDGPLTRDELRERLRAAGIVTAGQAMAHLTWLASADGGICRGPDRDGTATFVLARDWLRAHPDDPPDPLRELTVRHLRAHGPATAEDLAAWAGISRGTARRGWTSLADRLVEVPTERGPQWRLRSSATREVAAGLVRLLGPFDGYLLGWRDRTLVGSTAVLRRVNRGGGWLHATILVDGRIVGPWALERPGGAVRVAIEPFGRLPAGVPTAIRAEAADLQAFLGTPVEVARR